ncbi:hypothetical protein IF2G_05140 [Cordyceps javanica]|nr:hypothetical protein IF2G_05140 [Cordyceps javanica]
MPSIFLPWVLLALECGGPLPRPTHNEVPEVSRATMRCLSATRSGYSHRFNLYRLQARSHGVRTPGNKSGLVTGTITLIKSPISRVSTASNS